MKTRRSKRVEAMPESCWCKFCDLGPLLKMIVCPICGDKRCPHADWHGYGCSVSNEQLNFSPPATPSIAIQRIFKETN